MSVDEREQAARFHVEQDGMEYALTHSILRQLLEAYGVASAADVSLVRSLRGKPALAASSNPTRLQFNLSHTRGMAVFAFARVLPVGIDVECGRAIEGARDWGLEFLASEEQREFNVLPAADKARGFLNGWTRKEAFAKAIGKGLNLPLNSYAVSLTPGAPARLVRSDVPCGSVKKWMLADITRDPKFVAALAVFGRDIRIVHRTWPADAAC